MSGLTLKKMSDLTPRELIRAAIQLSQNNRYKRPKRTKLCNLAKRTNQHSVGPPVRRRSPYFGQKRRPAEVVYEYLRMLTANGRNMRSVVERCFNPGGILEDCDRNQAHLDFTDYVGFNIAELMRRIRHLLRLLKKIDSIDTKQYIWEDTVNSVYHHWRAILTYGNNYTYVYDILNELYNMYNRLMTIFRNLNGF
jgi:hypothetical protein